MTRNYILFNDGLSFAEAIAMIAQSSCKTRRSHAQENNTGLNCLIILLLRLVWSLVSFYI
jgi:hypothetical protein